MTHPFLLMTHLWLPTTPQRRPNLPTWCSRPYLILPQTTPSPLLAPGFTNEEREFLSRGDDFSQVLLGLQGEMIALFLQSLSFHTVEGGL